MGRSGNVIIVHRRPNKTASPPHPELPPISPSAVPRVCCREAASIPSGRVQSENSCRFTLHSRLLGAETFLAAIGAVSPRREPVSIARPLHSMRHS